MNLIRKTSTLALTALLAFSFAGCQKKTDSNTVAAQANAEFDTFVTEQFKDYVENDFTTLQQLLAHPETYDIDRSAIPVQLGEPWSEENYKKDVEEFEKSKVDFEAFDRDTLDAHQQETYDIMKDQIDLSEKMNDGKFEYLGNYYGLISGMQSNIMTLFTEYTIYSEQDMKDLVTLMNDTKTYLASINEYMKKQKEVGTFMSDKNVDELSNYCDKIISGEEGKGMVEVVKANIDAFNDVDTAKKDTYKAEIDEAFTSSVVPGYQSIKDTVNDLKSSDNNQLGLAHVKDGKAYYELLYRNYTGSTLSVKDASKMLDTKITSLIQDMSKTALKYQDAFQAMIAGDVKSGYDGYMDMLKGLDTWKNKDFPSIEVPEYEAVPAPKTVSDGVAAYYVIPRIDSDDINKIRVNEKSGDVTSMETLHTIAHEGLPGHLYQTNYAKQYIKTPYRLVACNYLGYTEGYANYAAAMAMNASKADEGTILLSTIMNDLNWALMSRLDIGIHYDGWTKEEAVKNMDQYNMGSIIDEVYDNLQTNPAAYLSYGVGYFEILDMKKKAQETLGDSFTELEFNTALLKSGDAPFSIVQKNIDAYVKSAK